MTAIHETAYPRLKPIYAEEELTELYSPAARELHFVKGHLPDLAQQVTGLTLLKVFQRVGYFPLWNQLPAEIARHMVGCLGPLFPPTISPTYDTSGTRSRHLKLIQDFLGVRAIGEETYQAMQQAAIRAAQTKEHLADITNVMLEELIKERMELPAFSRFVRQARAARGLVNRQCFRTVAGLLSPAQQQDLDSLLASTEGNKPPVLGTNSSRNRLSRLRCTSEPTWPMPAG